MDNIMEKYTATNIALAKWRVYGKLKVPSSYAANAFCIGFFCNLATDKKALATCRLNRNFQLRFPATSPMRETLYTMYFPNLRRPFSCWFFASYLQKIVTKKKSNELKKIKNNCTENL